MQAGGMLISSDMDLMRRELCVDTSESWRDFMMMMDEA